MRVRAGITLALLLVVLLGAAYYGWKTVISPATGGNSNSATGNHKPTCKNTENFHKGQIIKANDIVVNVYNAGAISGLAADTLQTLSRRGFQAGVADNAPGSIVATNVTILADNKRAPQVQLVASQFKGKVKFSTHRDLSPGIDVVVGDNFAGMKVGAKSQLKVKKDVSICTSIGAHPSSAAG